MQSPTFMQALHVKDQRPYLWGGLFIWSLVVLALFLAEAWYFRREAQEFALAEARSSYNKDLVYRRWATLHGGVYVPVTDQTPPNPYLADIPERDITTPSGRQLTLMNPAYMTRQVQAMGAEQYGLLGHITSLNPIRPENKPDAWEAEALRAFDAGAQEISSLEQMDGQTYLRLMHAMYVEAGCLKCHGKQGYTVGQVRGGISVSVPMAPWWAIANRNSLYAALGLGGLWVFGAVGLVLSAAAQGQRLLAQQRVEAELRTSEERYHSLFENSATPLWEEDFAAVKARLDHLRAEGVSDFRAYFANHPDEVKRCADWVEILNVNAESRRFFQAGDTSEAMRRLPDYFVENSWAVFAEELAAMAEGSLRYDTEIPILDLQDEPRLVAVRLSVAPECRATWARVLVSFNDITEQRRAEAALRESEASYRALFEKNQAIKLVIDPETGALVDVNTAAVEFYGYSREQLLAMHITDLNTLPPAEVNAEMERAKTERRSYFNFRHRLASGLVREVEVYSGPVEMGGHTLLHSIIHDITERKQAEERLRQSEAALRQAQRVAHVGSWVWHIPSNRLEWSDEMYHLFGLEIENFSGDLAEVIKSAIHPEDRAAVERSNAAVARDGQPVPLEYRVVWPDGSVHWVWGEAGELTLDEAGQPLRLSGIVQDITERKRAEAAIYERQQVFRTLVENSPDIIARYDRDCRRIYVNPAYLKTAQIPQQELLATSPLLRSPLSKAGAEVLQNLLRKVLTSGVTEAVDVVWPKADNIDHWYNIYASPEFNRERQVVSVMTVSRDITERKQAEAALRESRDLLQSVFSGLDEAVMVVDTRTRRIHDCNAATETMFGYGREELVGQTTELLHVDAAHFSAFGQAVEHALTGHAVLERQFQMRRRSGEVFPTEHFVRSIHTSEGEALMGISVVRDITTRVRAEAKLRQLSQAVEQSPATILITDTSGAIQYANPAFTRTTGYALDEALGQNPRILKSGETPPEEYARLWRSLLAGGEWRGELHNRKKSGELYWEFAIISPIKNDAGRITHFLAVKEDITERKQAEAELAATNARLEQAVWEANQLAIAAQAANRLKSEILANTSHELRTPLTGILGSLGLVLEGLCDTREEERSFIVTAYQASRHLLELINNLLDLAKIEAGKMEVELQPVDVALALAETETLARAQAQEKGLVLRVAETPPHTVWAKADPEKLRQILLNVVNNALKFTEQGEVELAARADLRAGVVRLTVRDTGIGVPLEQQTKLFQPFVQVDGTSTRRYGGTGLGLSLSRQFAELMNGSLTLESAGEGHGCTLTLTLPCGTATGLPLASRPDGSRIP